MSHAHKDDFAYKCTKSLRETLKHQAGKEGEDLMSPMALVAHAVITEGRMVQGHCLSTTVGWPCWPRPHPAARLLLELPSHDWSPMSKAQTL